MPVRAELTMTVPVPRAESFVTEWRKVAGWVATLPGCLRQTLSQVRQGDSDTFVITSDWVDRSTYEHFEHSSRQDAATADLRALRTSVAMRVLTIVDHVENR